MRSKPPAMRIVHRNIGPAAIVGYRLPLAGFVSILHRVSGALMFVLLPAVLWMFESSVSSQDLFARSTSVLTAGVGFLPGWFTKLILWFLLGAYLLHFIAGLRHLWMDVTHSVSKEQGQSSALYTLASSGLLWLLLGARLFGLY